MIGVVTFLLLLAKLTLYAAELNPVLARGLWPRALPMAPPTDADEAVLRAHAREPRGRPDERVGVGFRAHDRASSRRPAQAERREPTPRKPTPRKPTPAGLTTPRYRRGALSSLAGAAAVRER